MPTCVVDSQRVMAPAGARESDGVEGPVELAVEPVKFEPSVKYGDGLAGDTRCVSGRTRIRHGAPEYPAPEGTKRGSVYLPCTPGLHREQPRGLTKLPLCSAVCERRATRPIRPTSLPPGPAPLGVLTTGTSTSRTSRVSGPSTRKVCSATAVGLIALEVPDECNKPPVLPSSLYVRCRHPSPTPDRQLRGTAGRTSSGLFVYLLRRGSECEGRR